MIKVGSLLKTETAYDKDVNFTRDDVEYRVIIHWDDHDGYEATWLDDEGRFISSPDWADEMDNLYSTLDLAKPHTEVSL